jgi:hypothetical protein
MLIKQPVEIWQVSTVTSLTINRLAEEATHLWGTSLP